MPAIKQATLKNTRQLRETDKATGTATDLGEILAQTAGLALPADSGTVLADLLGLCNQTIEIVDDLVRVTYIVVSDEDTFIFPTTNNTQATDNGQAMVLTNSKEVNNTHTTSGSGIIQQVEPYGEASDKLMIGKFLTL